ncbi:MAG: serine/threonine protein kinase [Oligoflexales bacterium]|nr:serine/threonine protein kinase [Oligoflexales bacterium]
MVDVENIERCPIKIEHYRITSEIGAGGLGLVYKAIDERSGRTVAIKVLHKKYQKNPRFLGIFHRELIIVSRFKHKNIVEFISANFDPPNCYIVSEFIDGWSLYSLMKTCGPIPPLVALCIGIDILQGLDYLHLHDTIHSDLSSPNVLIDKSGRVLLTDFGLACQEEVEDYKNYMVGTPGFYSPEHITDTSIVPQSDIYCLALLIYEMMAGRKAVPASNKRHEVFNNMKNIDFENIPCTDRRMKISIVSMLKKALHINPAKRFKNTEQMIIFIYKILKKYEIRFSRYAIRQYLIDYKLSKRKSSNKETQDIYNGYVLPDGMKRP